MRIQKQVITYDFVSLVSDIGGTFGLFVGFSFFALWDILKDLAVKAQPLTFLICKATRELFDRNSEK